MKTKRMALLLLLPVLVATLLAACASNAGERAENTTSAPTTSGASTTEAATTDLSTTALTTSTTRAETTLATPTKAPEKWQSAYAEFLREVDRKEHDSYDHISFALRQMDGKSIPNLIIDRRINEGSKSLLTVYSYHGSVYELGTLENPGSYASVLYFSNTPSFPGLFWRKYGGSMERFGYLSIKNGEFVSERVWDLDRSTNGEKKIIDHSDNAALLRETKRLFVDIDTAVPETQLETQNISVESIAEIMRWKP